MQNVTKTVGSSQKKAENPQEDIAYINGKQHDYHDVLAVETKTPAIFD